MSAQNLRTCFSAGLLALALTPFHVTVAQSTGADPALEAAGKCATTSGTASSACGITRKAVLDFLAATPEDKAWASAMSCSGGAAGTGHKEFVEIRRQATAWGKNPGSPERIAAVTKVTGSEGAMCMLNAIVGSNNCKALLVSQRDAFHRNDPAGDPTKSWKAMFCK